MPEQSSVHFYLNWAKERIDEMDAALASFEVKASQAQAESKAKADRLVNDLKKQRDDFKTIVKKQTEAGEAAWAGIRADLETKWREFERQVQAYFASASKQIEQQQATFRTSPRLRLRPGARPPTSFVTRQTKWRPTDAQTSTLPSNR